MHRASNISNIGQGAITIIVTNRGGHSNRKKVHSRLLNSIRISLIYSDKRGDKKIDAIRWKMQLAELNLM